MYICIGIFVYMHVRVRIRACAFTMYMCNKRTNSESQIPSNPLEIPPPSFTHYYARQKKKIPAGRAGLAPCKSRRPYLMARPGGDLCTNLALCLARWRSLAM